MNRLMAAADRLLGNPATAGRKVVALLTIGFALLLLNVVTSAWLSSRSTEFTDLTISEQRLKALILQVLSAAQDAETGQRGYLLLGEEQYLEPFNKAVSDLPKLLQQLKELGSNDPEISTRTTRIAELVNERVLVLAQKTIDMERQGKRDEAIAFVRSGAGKKLMDEIRKHVADLQAHQEREVAQGVENLRRVSDWSYWANLISLLLIPVLGAITAMIVVQYIRELNAARTDLTTLNAGLEQLVEARTGEVMRANEEIQQFAYIVSHDLRSPLVNIMGFTSELEAIGDAIKLQQAAVAEKAPELIVPESRAALETELPEAINFIRASTAKMDRLINAILKLSREGRRALTPARINMAELVESISSSLKHQTQSAGAEVVVEELPELVTDRIAIEQVMSNLVENAVKYLEKDRPGRIVVSGRQDGPFNEYRVADNGRGIDPADRERVFELFRRAGRQDTKGEGLGLAFVRAIVRRLGGSINLQSEPGAGTTMIIRLPRILTQARSETAHVRRS